MNTPLPKEIGRICALEGSELCATRSMSLQNLARLRGRKKTSGLWKKLVDELQPVAIHAIVMVAVLLSIWIFVSVLDWTLGDNYFLFGFEQLRIKYIGEVGDVIAIARYFIKMLGGFKRGTAHN